MSCVCLFLSGYPWRSYLGSLLLVAYPILAALIHILWGCFLCQWNAAMVLFDPDSNLPSDPLEVSVSLILCCWS